MVGGEVQLRMYAMLKLWFPWGRRLTDTVCMRWINMTEGRLSGVCNE
jgi:hypothetical protein